MSCTRQESEDRTLRRTFLITHACVVQVDLRCQKLCVFSLRIEKTPHRTSSFIQHFSAFLILLFILFLTATDYTHRQTADWNQEYSLCDFAGRKSAWLPGRITSSHTKTRKERGGGRTRYVQKCVCLVRVTCVMLPQGEIKIMSKFDVFLRLVFLRLASSRKSGSAHTHT